MSVSPLSLSPDSPGPKALLLNPNLEPSPSPSKSPIRRNHSPTTSTTSPSFWTVTLESGCIPSLIHVAYDPTQMKWWGGSLPSPLAPFELLVQDFPRLLAEDKNTLDSYFHNLPLIDLLPTPNFKILQQRESLRSTQPIRLTHQPGCAQNQVISVVLESDLARERAFAVFAFLANAFVFSRPTTTTTTTLPPCLSQPLLRLAEAVNRQPITDYACCVLTNWELTNPLGEFSLSNLRILRTFTGLEAEKWFYMIHAVIEHQGGRALHAMTASKERIIQFMMVRKLQGRGQGVSNRAVALQRFLNHTKLYSVSTNKEEEDQSWFVSPKLSSLTFEESCVDVAQCVHSNLESVIHALMEMGDTLQRLPEKCPPEAFFDQIRPWLASWPSPGGVAYPVDYCTSCGDNNDDVNVNKPLPITMHLSGASGAQSSLLPAIDAFLGISYASSDQARTDLGAFIRQLKKFRNSMPVAHRELVVGFETTSHMRDLITALDEQVLSNPSSQLEDCIAQLKLTYNACIEELILFRRRHNEYASKYIKSMAARRDQPPPPHGVSPPSVQPARGTGGSDFAVHLARHITDTKKNLYDIRPKVVVNHADEH